MAYPDEDKMAAEISRRAGGDDEREFAAMAQMRRYVTDYKVATANQRVALEKNIGDLRAALVDGVQAPIPVDQIRHLLPPAQADATIQDLSIRSAVGSAIGGMKYASPEDVQQTISGLESGTGTAATLFSLRLRKAGYTADSGGEEGSTAGFAVRQQALTVLRNVLDARNSAIAADPAGYAAGEPTVMAAGAALDGAKDKTAAFDTYATATQAVQSHIGIPPWQQHLLSAQQAQSIAGTLIHGEGDVQAQMSQLAATYGQHWPQVFGDLVTLGKLPAAYQGVAALDDPNDAKLLARAINETNKSGKDWSDILGSAGGKSVAGGLKNDVRNDPGVQNLAFSLARSGASAGQIDGLLGSIETLAYAKQFYNRDTSAAADAVKSFIGKYEFLPNGGARVPVDKADAVTQGAVETLRTLTADKIAVPPVFGGLGQPTTEDYAASLRSAPTWITSPRNDALWLMDAGGRLVRDKGGLPVAVPFSYQPQAAAPTTSVPSLGPTDTIP